MHRDKGRLLNERGIFFFREKNHFPQHNELIKPDGTLTTYNLLKQLQKSSNSKTQNYYSISTPPTSNKSLNTIK